MALPPSSLSNICASVADFIHDGLDAVDNSIDISVGVPAEVSPRNRHAVNLFFYRFEPSGFVLHTRPGESWRIRLYCLITAFGISENSVSAGENELRLIGEVLRLFHEHPVMEGQDIGGEAVRLQVIYHALNEDQINQIWSTQGDTVYHPSIAYEMGLTPVVPNEQWTGSPLVGAIGTETAATMAARFRPFGGETSAPPVMPVTVNIQAPDWAPAICFIYAGQCAKSLWFDVESDAFDNFDPMAWIAGDTADTVNLVWQAWDSTGWHNMGPPFNVAPYTEGIDPDAIPPDSPGVFPVTIPLPYTLPPDESSAQLLLFAERSYLAQPDSPAVTIRSNPLLITLYRNGVSP